MRDDIDQFGAELSAYLDGELEPAEHGAVEEALRQDPELRRLLQDLREVRSALGTLPRHAAPAAVMEEVTARLERNELVDGQPKIRTRRLRPGMWAMASAAVIALAVLGGGYWLSFQEPFRYSTRMAESTESAVTPAEVDESARTAAAERTYSRKESSSLSKEDEADTVNNRANRSLLAAADAESKVRAGLPLETLRDHDFANESVQLEVTVRHPLQQEYVVGRLVEELNTLRLVDVSGEGEPTSASHEHRFFVRGKPDRNFSGPGEEQLLIRIPKRGINRIVDSLASAAGDGQALQLNAGPIAVRGAEDIRRRLHQTPHDDDGFMAPMGAAGAKLAIKPLEAAVPPSETVGPFWGLFQAIGGMTSEALVSGEAPADAREAEADAEKPAIDRVAAAPTEDSGGPDAAAASGPSQAADTAETDSPGLVEQRFAEAKRRRQESPATSAATMTHRTSDEAAGYVTLVIRVQVRPGETPAAASPTVPAKPDKPGKGSDPVAHQ